MEIWVTDAGEMIAYATSPKFLSNQKALKSYSCTAIYITSVVEDSSWPSVPGTRVLLQRVRLMLCRSGIGCDEAALAAIRECGAASSPRLIV